MRVQAILPGVLDPDAAVKRQIWTDAEQRYGVDVRLPPTLLSSSSAFDLSGTLTELRSCQLVVADLTFERPSCYFELGLAQALGIPSIIISMPSTLRHQHGPALEEHMYSSLDEYREIVQRILATDRSS
jgi:hypothetical protein